MLADILGLLLSLAIILISCELFTNGIEWLGKKLSFGEGVVGSIFAAVGTCMPETIIPIIAILFSGGAENSEYIGIGAIIGAPFMLGTLAFFITGLSVLLFRKKRKTGIRMNVNIGILSRDIRFFILVYSTGILSTFINLPAFKYAIAAFLTGCYIYYLIITVKHDIVNHCELETLYITRFLNIKPGMPVILMQIIIALAGIVLGAELFVDKIAITSQLIGVSVFALSLLITPVATELPEKFNSVLWIRRKKDTLALGNITGAMVFQSCIPVSIGILATAWELDIKAIVSAALAILSAFVTYAWIKVKGKLDAVPLLAGGAFYLAFIVFLVLRGFK